MPQLHHTNTKIHSLSQSLTITSHSTFAMTTSMLKNRYFDDDDDESSTASIRTEDEPENVAAKNRENHPVPAPSGKDDDEAAIAAQYAKKMSSGSRQGTSSSGSGGFHPSTGSGSDPKRRKVDSRPKVTMETILDPTYGIAQLVTNLPTRMKTVTPDHSTRKMSATAAKNYMNALLQSYYDVIMNDWLRIPSLTASSTGTTAMSATLCANSQQQQILQDIFYRVETLGGTNKGPVKDAIASLRHVHCRNPLLYDAIGIQRTNTILQQYEQDLALQQLPVAPAVEVFDPNVRDLENLTGNVPDPSADIGTETTPSLLPVLPIHTSALPATTIGRQASSVPTALEPIENRNSEHVASVPTIVPTSSNQTYSDDEDETTPTLTTTTNHVPPRNHKRRIILEDSDEDE